MNIVLSVAAALGMILPAATVIVTWWTPVAATGLALVMLLAFGFHQSRREFSGMGTTLVLLLMAAFVAYGRFMLVLLS